MTDTQRKK